MRQAFEIASATNLDQRDKGATIIEFREIGPGFPCAVGVSLFLNQAEFETDDWMTSWCPHGAVRLRDLAEGFEYAKRRMWEQYGIELGKRIV